MKRIQQVSLSLFLLLCLFLSACGAAPGGTQTSFSLEDVPAFSGEPYVVLSDNQPDFTQEELDQYVDAYIDEGRFDQEENLKIFPVAKSTEVFMLNKTDWDLFARDTGASLEELSTIEGVTGWAIES